MLVSLTHKFSYTYLSLDDPAVYKNFYVPECSYTYVTVSCWFLISLLHWPLFRGGGECGKKALLHCEDSAVKFSPLTPLPPPPPQAGQSERDVFTLTGSKGLIAAGLSPSITPPPPTSCVTTLSFPPFPSHLFCSSLTLAQTYGPWKLPWELLYIKLPMHLWFIRPLCNVFDAGKSITWASGKGWGPK